MYILGIKCTMEDIQQESDEDGGLLSPVRSQKKQVPNSTKGKKQAESLKNHLKTVRKWKYRKRTCKFE